MNARREMWTQEHGPIPKGFIVYILNGQPNDLRSENLACVPRYPKNVKTLIAPFMVRIQNLERQLKLARGEN